MLDGEAEFLLEDRREVAREGAMVFIPRGCVHAFRVNSDSSRFLNLYTGAGFERSITEMGQATNERTLPPKDWKPPAISQERMTRLFARSACVPSPCRIHFASNEGNDRMTDIDVNDPKPRPMIAILDAHTGMTDALRALIVELGIQVREEPGCVTFTVYQARDVAGRFYIYEIYASAGLLAST